MGVEDFGAVFAEPIDAALKIHGLADDDGADAELPDEAAAIPARSESGYHDFVAVGALAAGFAKGVRLTVRGRIAFLHPTIVAASQQLSFAIEKCSANGDSAFGKTEAGFVHGGFQHGEVCFSNLFCVRAHCHSLPNS